LTLYLFVTAYTMVFVAELIGDKALYSIGALAVRYPRLPVAVGILLAFMVKMWAAVFAGRLLSALPQPMVAAVSALTFFVMAIVLWFKKAEGERGQSTGSCSWPYVMWISFSAVFFTEWGDPGQVAAMTLSAGYQHRLMIWLGATAAIATKGALAITLGASVQRRIPQNALRYAALCIFLTMGGLSLLRALP